ncbi:MAG: hypothetical protein KDC35_17965 [Acidobacteria bacterium]|nr:hypothetical protein [Acidobacteriota bacterium]
MPSSNTNALESALDEFQRLMTYLQDDLEEIIPDGKGKPQRILRYLIANFRQAAKSYFDTAVATIEGATEVGQRRQKAYYYGLVLTKIEDHIGFLAELNRQLVTGDLQQPFVDDFIRSAASHFSEPPVIITATAARFQYIHFNYVDGIGVIAYPAHVLANSVQHVNVLLHEVAGFWVARERKACRLHSLAKVLRQELQDSSYTVDQIGVWESYWGQYKRSWLERAPVKINVQADACRIENSATIRHYFKLLDGASSRSLSQDVTLVKDVETDDEWQMNWLGEFMEDLFGAQELHVHYFQALAHALLRTYPNPEIGDEKHPTPILRLQVVLELLNLLVDGQVDTFSVPRPTMQLVSSKVEDVFQLYPVLRNYLSFGNTNPNPLLKCTASIIVQCARFPGKLVQSADERLPITEPARKVIDLAVKIIQDRQPTAARESIYNNASNVNALTVDYWSKATQTIEDRMSKILVQSEATGATTHLIKEYMPCGPATEDVFKVLKDFSFIYSDGDVIPGRTIPPLTI